MAIVGIKSREWSALALGVTWWDLDDDARRRQISVGEVGVIDLWPNGAAFLPDVAADTAAPQAVGKDRRANIQIPSQHGMTHWTDRHQRSPLMTALTAS